MSFSVCFGPSGSGCLRITPSGTISRAFSTLPVSLHRGHQNCVIGFRVRVNIYDNDDNRVVVKINGKIKIIPVQDIHYLEAADDYVKIVTQEGAFLKNKTMAFFEKTLDMQQFARVHRSYILNVNQVTRIEPYEKENHLAMLKSGAKVPVSKTGYPKLKSALGL